MIGISGSPIWSKTLMELIFDPVVNFGIVSQIHSPHVHDLESLQEATASIHA